MPAMYIRETKRRGGAVSLQVVQSYRPRGGTPRQKVLAHIGSAKPGPALEALRHAAKVELARLREQTSRPTLPPGDDCVRRAVDARQVPRTRHGPAAMVPCADKRRLREEGRMLLGFDEVLGQLYANAGLNRLWTARHRHSRRVFYQAVMMRFQMPGRSKRAHARALNEQNRPVGLDQVYRMMDQLDSSRIGKMQRLLAGACAELVGKPVAAVFFDATTLAFAGEGTDELRRKGYSKDGKHSRPQVVLCVLMGQDGLPLGYQVHPGSTADVSTLSDALADLRKTHGADLRSVLVADAGMLSRANLAEIAEHGHDHIVAARLRALPKRLRERVCDLKNYTPDDSRGHRRLDLVDDGNRLIVVRDPKRAEKDKHQRDERIAKAEAAIKGGDIGHKRYVCVEGGTPRLDQDAIDRDAQYDGLHGVWTSLLDTDAELVRNRYHDLWAIENGFRVLKSDLGVRPIFHWTPRRIRAHIAICFAAFSLLRILMHRLRTEKAWAEPCSEQTVLDEIGKVQASLVVDDNDGSEQLLPSKPSRLQKAIYQMLNLRLPVFLQPLAAA